MLNHKLAHGTVLDFPDAPTLLVEIVPEQITSHCNIGHGCLTFYVQLVDMTDAYFKSSH